MGCAASKGFGGAMPSAMSKDPEDFSLDHISFKKVNVTEYDEFFSKFADPVNELIDYNNDLNGTVSDIMDAAGTILGGYKATPKFAVKSADFVIVDLLKADGKTRLTPAEVTPLLAKAEVTSADAALTAAKVALRLACQGASTAPGLKVAEGKLAGEGLADEIKKFNDGLDAVSKALGAGFKVAVSVIATKAHGATTFDVLLEKPVFATPDAEKPVLKPLTLLDVAIATAAKDIIAAQAALAEQASAAAAAAKDLEGVAFGLKKKRIDAGKPAAKAPAEGQEAPSEDGTAKLSQAVSGANVSLFKLRKACWGATEAVTMTSALAAVLKNLRAFVEKRAKDAHKDVKDVIHFKPTVKVGDDGALDFDWGVKVDLPNMPEFPKCLPAPSKMVYDEVLRIKDTVKHLTEQFPGMKQKVEALVEESKEAFKEPKAKFEATGMDTMATMKAVAMLGRNTATIGTSSSTVLTSFVNTVKRVGDELKKAVEEADNLRTQLLK